MLKGFIHEKAKYGKMINLMIYRIPIPAMYRRNFKPKIFTDITMPAKLFSVQILARYLHFHKGVFHNPKNQTK